MQWSLIFPTVTLNPFPLSQKAKKPSSLPASYPTLPPISLRLAQQVNETPLEIYTSRNLRARATSLAFQRTRLPIFAFTRRSPFGHCLCLSRERSPRRLRFGLKRWRGICEEELISMGNTRNYVDTRAHRHIPTVHKNGFLPRATTQLKHFMTFSIKVLSDARRNKR